MDFKRALKPSRWKIAFSLIPAIIPLAYVVLYINDYLDFLSWFPVEVYGAAVDLIFYVGYPLSLPFEPLLTPLRLWERDAEILGTMATFGGYVLVAVIYSIFLYLLYSAVSLFLLKPKR